MQIINDSGNDIIIGLITFLGDGTPYIVPDTATAILLGQSMFFRMNVWYEYLLISFGGLSFTPENTVEPWDSITSGLLDPLS